MANITLFGLGDKYLEVLQKIDNNGGELTGELAKELAEVETDMLAKQDSYISVITFMDKQIELYKDYKKQCEYQIDKIESRKDRLKQLLLEHMKKFDISKVETILGSIIKQKGQGSLEITIAPEMLPEEYQNVVTTISADKVKIKEAIKNGINIVGAKLKDGEEFIKFIPKKKKE